LQGLCTELTNKNLAERNFAIWFSEYAFSLQNDVGTATKHWGWHFFLQVPEKVNIENWPRIRQHFVQKRRLKCQERGSCSLKPKDIRCFAKINSRPIAENLRFRNTKIILLSSQTSKESTSLILDLKISQNPRKVSLCKLRKFPKHLFVLFQENISCFKRIKFFILSQKKQDLKPWSKESLENF